jgi:hypothetical protein
MQAPEASGKLTSTFELRGLWAVLAVCFRASLQPNLTIPISEGLRRSRYGRLVAWSEFQSRPLQPYIEDLTGSLFSFIGRVRETKQRHPCAVRHAVHCSDPVPIAKAACLVLVDKAECVRAEATFKASIATPFT